MIYYVLFFNGINKSNTLSTLIWRKICLIGNFVEENWWSRRTHEELCFVSSKCFYSLNKFNKTSFDWQESALPQCLLFALTFLVSSCAPFWMRWRLKICAAHTLYRLGTSGTFIQVSTGLNVLLMTHFTSVILCHWEFCKLSNGVQYKVQFHHCSCHQMVFLSKKMLQLFKSISDRSI